MAYRLWCDVGIVIRRAFRRELLARGMAFTEDKGWLTSRFVVTGATEEQKDWLVRVVKENQ